MKIGIMTYWWANDNYGQLLQCYALQQYLRDKGHEPFLIRYNWRTDLNKAPVWSRLYKLFNPICVYKYLKRKIIKTKVIVNKIIVDREFDAFRSKYITQSSERYDSYSTLFNNPPDADAYIVGSDQVWNFFGNDFYVIRNAIHAYMLDFGDKDIKKIAYAASWSVYSVPNKFKKEIYPLLRNFNYVSVREKNGIELCKDCGRNDAELVCDPTLLLDSNTYRKLYKENTIRKISDKYLLLYLLGNDCDFDLSYIQQFAISKGLKLVYIPGSGANIECEKYDATIYEWLYLFDNAEYIITNSFHGCVFSYIFKKQFGVFRLNGRFEGMNTRLITLFEELRISDRFISKYDFSILDKPYEINNSSFNGGENMLKILNETIEVNQ